MAKSKSSILVVSLGGTITSEVKSGIVKQAGFVWDEKFFEGLDNRFLYSMVALSGYSSENATVADYRKALTGVVTAVNNTEPDGILILHGTDSIAYFAQLAIRVLSHLNRPVIITGSKLPPSQSGSDAKSNLKLSLGFLGAAIEGSIGSKTFGIIFNDSFTGESTFVHASGCMSPDIMGDIKSFYDAGNRKKIDFKDREYTKRATDFVNGGGVTDGVLVIPAAPGIPYKAISLDGVQAIVIESYHSGTADCKGLLELVTEAKSRGIPCYLGPVPSKGNVYDSRNLLEKAGVKVLKGMPFEGCWAEAVLG